MAVAQRMTIPQPGSLARFWLWAAVGVLAAFGAFSFGAGAIVWALLAALIGLLAARSVTRRGAALAIAVGVLAPAIALLTDSAAPLIVGPPLALACAMVHSRRNAIVLATAIVVAGAAIAGLALIEPLLAVIVAPVLVVGVALATGRPQREAAGAITGAGLALFAFGAPEAGIPLTLAGAVLVLALGMRRKRLAVSSA